MLTNTLRSPQPWSRELFQCICSPNCCRRGSRTISTNSAIARALRETSAAERRYPGNKARPLFRKELAAFDRKIDESRTKERYNKRVKRERKREVASEEPENKRELSLEEAITLEETMVRGNTEPRPDGPVAVPYTTAASQFIYGVSAVRAALISKRRKCYKLYLHERAVRRTVSVLKAERNPSATDIRQAKEEETDNTLDNLAAKVPGLEVKKIGDGFLPIMNKMSDGRPHNGVILEASPLPASPVISLRPALRTHPWFDFELDRQSREQKAINGTNNRIPYNSHGWRYPFILYLDGIVDPGNLGAIIRSAYYLGVDAVAVSTRATAPLDGVTIKSSSGAAEAMPILTVNNPLSFLTRSAVNGWRVYAADVPPPPPDNFNVTANHFRHALDPKNTSPLVSFTRPHTLAVLQDHTPLLSHPAILMLGGESAGFRQSIKNKANYLVGVRGTKGLELGVDSLNVSVAAALIMLEMLRKPKIAGSLKKQLYRQENVAKGSKGSNLHVDDQIHNDSMLF